MDASQEADRARVRLRVAARGYDRDEVNACLAENDRRAEHDQARLLDIEAQLTEADHRAKALEAKVAELEHRDDQGPPESVQWLHDVTDQILRVTSDDAHELMIKMENEAKAEKVEAERAVADMLAAAQARAAEIRGAASSDRDAAINMRQESHQQVELYLEESKAMARARARRKEAHLQELTLERDRVEEQRRAVLEDFNHVRSSLEKLERYLGRPRALRHRGDAPHAPVGR